MTPDQDERLLAQQFETIFTKYYSVVKYFALMLLKSEEDAKDITQDVFTKLSLNYGQKFLIRLLISILLLKVQLSILSNTKK